MSIPSIEAIPGLEGSSPSFRAISLSNSSNTMYAYFRSLIKSPSSLKKANSNGISWLAPYCPSHEMFTVVGTFS